MPRTILILLLTLLSFRLYEDPNSHGYQYKGFSAPDVLNEGQIYRLEIDQSGIYRLSTDWFQEQLGFIPQISQIHLFGIFGGVLQHDSDFEHTESLEQLAINVDGDGNDLLTGDESIFFYAQGADIIRFDEDSKEHEYLVNPFTIKSYVLLKISNDHISRRVQTASNNPVANPSNRYWFSSFYHDDKVNLLDDFISTQGSGQQWYSDELTNREVIDLRKSLAIPESGLKESKVTVRVAGRSRERESIRLDVNEESRTQQFSPVNTGNIEALYARNIEFSLTEEELSFNDKIALNFFRIDREARAWLDYAHVQGWASLTYQDEPLTINNASILNAPENDGLIFENLGGMPYIWDISNPYLPMIIEPNLSTNQFTFSTSSENYSEYVLFNNDHVLTPVLVGEVNNIDLIKEGDVDLVIIAPSTTRSAAERLKEHRSQNDGLTSVILDPQDVYNGFSAGRQDPTALRNYFRALYRNHSRFTYVLLFGDASFDYRHINTAYPEDNLVPTFETFNSLDPLLSFPTDDYFALLDDGENGRLIGDLDIAIGRITVSSSLQANQVVDKMITYDQDEVGSNTWRTRAVFVADDEDNNLHINDADVIATELARNQPLLNQDKIYFDAYPQESTPGGNRYPSASNDLNQAINQGALVVNYLGHGGPNGWAQERVLKIDDINNWSNFDRLPLIVTATCSFTGFDDPSFTSAGEVALLKPNGGALALFTTVRSVFASKNFQLTRSVFRNLFERENDRYLTIGEIMLRAKNDNPTDNTNSRKFFLIGDPTIRLKIPELEVVTDEINGTKIESSETAIPTSALDLVSIKGSVRLPNGIIVENYNGMVDLVVYDKAAQVRTFANDDRSFVKSFSNQENIIYLGSTEVKNGLFETEFTIPVDIDYAVGLGKISYFAEDEFIGDAAGFSQNLLIGGSSQSPQFDDSPPSIQLFLNNRNFETGDLVPKDNLAIVDLSDNLGINLSTAAIGHEITAILDNDPKSTLILNNLALQNDERDNGLTIEFSVLDLETGMHTLTVQAFDVANNVSEESITFEVSEEIQRTILEISNAPNPFSYSTEFNIRHELLGANILLQMSVFDESGRLIDRRSSNVVSENNVINYEWAVPNDLFGTFFCQFSLRNTTSGETSDSYVKKVVILK